jgi:hypothetical protein
MRYRFENLLVHGDHLAGKGIGPTTAVVYPWRLSSTLG